MLHTSADVEMKQSNPRPTRRSIEASADVQRKSGDSWGSGSRHLTLRGGLNPFRATFVYTRIEILHSDPTLASPTHPRTVYPRTAVSGLSVCMYVGM